MYTHWDCYQSLFCNLYNESMKCNVRVVAFTTYWKFWYCCIHCLFGVNECQWLIYTHTFPFVPTWYYLMIPMIPWYVLCFHWLYAQFMNTRLVMMSVSLCIQTGLHCFINYSSPKHKSLIPKYSIHFSHFCTQ